MSLQVDSTRLLTLPKGIKLAAPTNAAIDVFEKNTKENRVGDTLTLMSNVEEKPTVKTENSNKKKWLLAAGITIGAIAIGVAAVYFLKNKSSRIVGESIENLKQLDNFNVFKDLKMCKNLSMAEKKQAFNVLSSPDNKNIFLAVLSGDKPMALMSERVVGGGKAGDAIDILKKLNLGKNFEWVQGSSVEFANVSASNMYFVNRKEFAKVIERNKDIYCSILNLSPSSSIKKIYSSLLESTKSNNNVMRDDLLGISLGFPRYDSMIYHLEQQNNLLRDRTSKEFIDKLLKALKSENSPYKNLSTERLQDLENAIKNINRKNLEEIAIKGSYHDGLFSFINYCDDSLELMRIGNSTNNFNALFGK